LRFALALLLLTACDESPFGTRHAQPGEAALGRLNPVTTPNCFPVALGFPMVGLGNSTSYFFIANSNPSAPQLYKYTVSGHDLMQQGNPISAASEKIADVAVKHGNCVYVSTDHKVGPAPFSSGDCGSFSQDPDYQQGPVVFAFDSNELFYFAHTNNGLWGRIDAAGQEQLGNDLPVTAVRLTINNGRSEVWIAYQISTDKWEVLAFDKNTLKQTGHIAFPWPNADLAGMEWDDSASQLYAIANQRTPVICNFDFVQATL
jgi:hypothetical protein